MSEYLIILMTKNDYERCLEVVESYQKVLDKARAGARKSRGSADTGGRKPKPELIVLDRFDAVKLPDYMARFKQLSASESQN